MSASAAKHFAFNPTSLEETEDVLQDGPTLPDWYNFKKTQKTPKFVGTSPSRRVTVFVDPDLGQPVLQNAEDLLRDSERIVTANDALFGTVGGPVNVIVFALHGFTDGRGGADHQGCNYASGAAIEVCASFGNSMRVSALFEAELSECSMGGNLCGVNTGEALSRWCAAVISKNALPDFATAPRWAQQGMPDFINKTDPTDGNPVSTGCGMAFLSWLMSQGYGLDQIAQEMVILGDSGTSAQLYANLTSDSIGNAWPKFRTAVKALPLGVTSDDPFGAFRPKQVANQAVSNSRLATNIVNAILADVAVGKPAPELVAGVEVILAGTNSLRAERAINAACYPKPRPLFPPD